MTDLEALNVIRNSSKDFAKSLVSQFDARGRLSDKQWPWVHTLAKEHQERQQKEADAEKWAASRIEAVVQHENQMDGVFALFASAKGQGQLKFPKIRLIVKGEGFTRHYRLSVAGERSRNPGSITIVLGEERDYVGRISTDGIFFPAYGVLLDNHPGLIEKLTDLANDPEGVAREYGHLTGSCCFCGLTLTDERSTEVGYGPVCAGKWNLPWGGKRQELAMVEVAEVA